MTHASPTRQRSSIFRTSSVFHQDADRLSKLLREQSAVKKFAIGQVLFLSLFSFSFAAHAADETKAAAVVSCECEKPKCGDCEKESGETFYTAKCGPGNERVKSCKKPTCVAVDDAKACWAALGKGVPEKDAVNTPTEEFVGRKPTSVPADAVEAGEIKEISGAIQLKHKGGGTESPRKGSFLYVGDTIDSGANGKMRASLKDASEITLSENSRLTVDKVEVDQAAAKRQIALGLLMGKVRSHVQKEYKNDNYYRVHTPSAVAGVRGTNFIMSFDPSGKEWVSEVTTVDGLVHLENPKASMKKSDEVAGRTSIDIPAGTYASIVSTAPAQGSSDGEINEALSGGVVSPLYKIKERDLQILRGQDFLPPQAKKEEPESERNVASASSGDAVCENPAGQFNQCSWTCEGNPKGQKTCRTDLPGVSCVRRLCGAGGQWGDMSRVPSSLSGTCQPSKPVVQDCGTYW